MKTLLAFALSAVLTGTSFAGDHSTIVLSKVFAEATPDTREMILKSDSSSETLHVDRNAALDDKDIAETALIEGGQAVGVRITLTQEGKRKFAELTKESIGKRVAIIVKDQVISAPHVIAEITGGSMDIAGAFTKESAEKIVQEIQQAKNG